MHRMKIGLAAAVILVLATLGIYMGVSGSLKEAAQADVESRIDRASRGFAELSRLRAADSALLAAKRARAAGLVALFDKPDETARRQGAFAECEAINAGLQKEGRKAFIVAVLDRAGKVVARDLNPNDMYGEDLKAQYKAVSEALAGAASSDVVLLKNRTTLLAVAPIAKADGSVAGALLIGSAFSVKLAQATRDAIGAEVAYFHGGKVQASSFASADGEKEDPNKTQALASLLFTGEKLADAALQKGGPSAAVRTSLDGADFVAVATPILGNLTDRTAGGVLLVPFSSTMAQLAGSRVMLLGLIAVLVALGAAVLTAKRFLGPLDKIELAVAEIINGKIDTAFEPVGPDFEGLSNSLNVMLARLLGREDPNEDAVEEEDEEKKWKADEVVIDEGDGNPSPHAAALSQESEVAYFPRLFTEYANALRSSGRPSEGLSVPAFMAKLRLAEAGLKQKWTCKMVRFQLMQRGADLVFRAHRIG
jgi:hypothetical protein